MAKLLAIESSASVCSIALGINGNLSVREQQGARTHTQYMLALIDEVLQEQQCSISDLDAIVFAAGPASFTGVRLAASVAKSLAYAANIPLVPISSLKLMVQTTARLTASFEPCLVIADARMGEVYIAEYGFDTNGIAYAIMPDEMLALNQVQLELFQAKRLVGDAIPLLVNHAGFSSLNVVEINAQAQDLIVLGQQALDSDKTETALSAQAIYLRDKSSWKTVEQQQQSRNKLKDSQKPA